MCLSGSHSLLYCALLTRNDAERLRHFGQNVRRTQKLFALVRRADNRTQPRLVLGHGREAHRWRKDSRFKELLRKLERLYGIAHVNRNNRRLTHLELEPALLQLALEKFRIGPEFLHQFFTLWRIQQRERRLARRRCSRWMRSRKEKRPSSQIQEIDQIPRATHVASHRADRLAHRPHLDVHAPVTSEVVDGAASPASQHARSVRVVHHHDAVVFFREIAKLRQRRDVSIHEKTPSVMISLR